MAIAIDATSANDFGSTASATLAHTCTGSNLVLFAGVGCNGNSGDVVTGVTYNGSSMTRLGNTDFSGSFSMYVYYIINPATGTNDIVASLSSSRFTKVSGLSVTGALQSGVPDGQDLITAGPTTSISVVPTVVASNCWVFSFVGNDANNAMTGSTGINAVATQVGNSYYWGHSNGTVSTGAYTTTWTCSSQRLAEISLSIAPVAASIFATRRALLNVGV